MRLANPSGRFPHVCPGFRCAICAFASGRWLAFAWEEESEGDEDFCAAAGENDDRMSGTRPVLSAPTAPLTTIRTGGEMAATANPTLQGVRRA